MIETLLIIVLFPIACSIVLYMIGLILATLFAIGQAIQDTIYDIYDRWF